MSSIKENKYWQNGACRMREVLLGVLALQRMFLLFGEPFGEEKPEAQPVAAQPERVALAPGRHSPFHARARAR